MLRLTVQSLRAGVCPSVRPYLDTEVASVYVVPQEEVARVGRRTAHFKQLHQIEELAVDVSAHCGHGAGTRVEGSTLHRWL